MEHTERIGPYRVLRPIATGGTAEVYEVQDVPSGERLALKLLVGPDTSTRRFDREYEAMTRLNHPNIVRVYHYGFHHRQPWLTMELLRGVPAQSHVKRAGKPGSPGRTDEVMRIGYHVSKALHYIHDRGIVHRDLKSANVLVLPDERVKLLDFGAAALLDAMDRITLDGEFVGTFAYASPEQLRGRPLDGRSDLYSLGVLLYRLATGRRPFESELVEDLVRMHLHETPPDPRLVTPELPAGFGELVVSMLAKDPSERPRHAGLVARELETLYGRPFPSRSRLALHDPASTTREEARARLWALLEASPGRPVLVDGDDGSDRIRVLDAARTGATERGWSAHTCLFKPGEPWASVVRLILEVGAGAGTGAELPEPLPEPLAAFEAAAQPAALADPETRTALAERAADIVRARPGEGAPALLILQELHRASAPAVAFLLGVRERVLAAGVPLKIVASARSTEIEEGAELARELSSADHLHLDPLTPREVAVGVGHMLGRRPPPADIARRLHEVCAGQPLYVEEAVRDLVELGAIEADGNRLAWADQSTSMALPPPERAFLAATRMLDGLPAIWRRVLEALVVADDAAEIAVLAKMLGWSERELGVVLGRLAARGFLRWHPEVERRPHWRHPVLADQVAEAMHPCRRALLERLLADGSRQLPPSRGGVRAMVSAGRLGEAARAAVVVATGDVERAAVRSALVVLDSVVDRVSGTAGAQDEREAAFAELFLLHARCIRTTHPTDPRNARSLARAKTIAEGLDVPKLVARVHLAQARLFAAIGHYTNYRRSLKAAWRVRPEDTPGVGAEIATELSASYRMHGDLQKAEGWVETAIVLAEASGRIALLAPARSESGACLLARGRLADAERELGGVIEACEQAGHLSGLWLALALWATTLRHQGRYSEALDALRSRMPEASQGEDPMPYIQQLMAMAWIELDLSRLGRAQECQEELEATIHRGEHLHLRLEAKILEGRILLASGQYRQAAYVLGEAHRGARSADLPVLAEHARALHAETLFALGDREAAATAFQSAVLGLLGSGDQTMLAEGCRGRARIQATERDPDEIFRPAQHLLDEQPMPLLRLERWLARGAWFRAKGDKREARRCLTEAATLLDEVGRKLSDTDRAALRVHPWTIWIRRGLGR